MMNETANPVSLIVGADGQIGRSLSQYLSSKGQAVVETTRRIETRSTSRIRLDLADDPSSWQLPSKLSVAYFCAAVSSLDECRQHPDRSARVNVRHTVTLAEMSIERGAFVVFLSTDRVYDGSVPFRRPEDPVCPQTEYGRQKAEAERQLLSLGERVAIVRLTKVLGQNVSLLHQWVNALKNGEIIHPFSDMVMAPVPLMFSIEVLRRVAERQLSGIVQVSGSEDVSYARIAERIAEKLGVSSTLVQPSLASAAKLSLEHIPLHTTLDSTRLREELGLESPEIWLTISSILGFNF
jgi:dTDP-4-dehydrorhamnose reductase